MSNGDEDRENELMSSRESIVCNLCGSPESRLKFRESYRGEVYSVVRCLGCGLVYVNPRPSPHFHAGSFDEVSPEEEDSLARLKRKQYYLRWLRVLTAARGSGRLLDIGCGTGVFLELVRRESDFQGEGLEATKQFVDFCRGKGLAVSRGEIESVSLENDLFDIITMWDVLEHLRDPRGALTKVNRLLAKDGLLLVKVPNIRSLNLAVARRLVRIRGRKMFLRDHPLRHLYFFSPAALRKMVSSAGFRVTKVATEESAFSTISQSRVRAAVRSLFQCLIRLSRLGLNDEIVLLARKP